jgi:hypothetical protein
MRWYLIFQFLLGLPPKDHVLAAIEKLSEMNSLSMGGVQWPVRLITTRH